MLVNHAIQEVRCHLPTVIVGRQFVVSGLADELGDKSIGMFCSHVQISVANGVPKVADYYERALYNHILAQQDTLSGMVCYFLPLMTGAYKVYSTPEQSFWCCVGSGFESHSKYAESIYFHGDNELFVNLFIPSELSWEEKGLKLRQTTQFPSADNTAFEILSAPKNKFKLSFRYPSWSGQPTVRINGKKVSVKGNPSSYISINRTWHAGDRIDVTYPMTLRVETTPDSRSKGAILSPGFNFVIEWALLKSQ